MELVALLGERQPLYGLQPRGLQLGEIPHLSVEAAADTAVKAIRKLSGHGAIHLLGHSFGGSVAFEIARMLEALGRPVASLTLVDTTPPDHASVKVKNIPDSRVHEELLNALRLNLEFPLEIDATVLTSGNAESFVQHLHATMVDHGFLPEHTQSALLYGPLRTFAAARRAVYTPSQTYSRKVHLALVRDPRLGETDDRAQREDTIARWRQWAPDLDVWHGPGHHFSILRPPHVAALAEWWRDAALRERSGRR
jgi:arthrofactin-type cyclic lipopeptide synthetase C